MEILVLGGTGLISREIVGQAVKAGHAVTVFNRGSKKLPFEKEVKTILGDKSDKEDFAAKMKGLSFDVVIDMIAFNEADARQTVGVFKDSAKQIIFTSSVAAYARPYRSFPVREESEGYCMDLGHMYGYEKARMEKYLVTAMQEGGAAITILRPSLTFGVGCQNLGALRQNSNLVHRIKNKKPLVLFGDGTIAWSFTFTPDLARGYLLACGNEKTYNEGFHVVSDEVCMWKDLYLSIGENLGMEPIFAYAPSASLEKAMPSLFAHIEYEKKYCHVFDCSKFKSAAPEFSAKISLKAGVERIMEWWEKEGNPFDPAKDALEDQICDACEAFEKDLIKRIGQ